VGPQQDLDLPTQVGIPGTGPVQVGGPLGGAGFLQRGEKDGLDRRLLSGHGISRVSGPPAMRQTSRNVSRNFGESATGAPRPPRWRSGAAPGHRPIVGKRLRARRPASRRPARSTARRRNEAGPPAPPRGPSPPAG